MMDQDDGEHSTVYVACRDESLRLALSRRIDRMNGFRVVADGPRESWAPPGAVVVPVADASPDECRAMRLNGFRPVVLAALPSATQRALYEASGAVYLEMDPDPAPLLAVLRQASNDR